MLRAEYITEPLQRGEREHISPYDPDSEKWHYRFHNRPPRNTNEASDKTEMDELSAGVGEAEVAPVSGEFAKVRREQCRHRTTCICRPKEKEREAPSQMQRNARALFTSPG